MLAKCASVSSVNAHYRHPNEQEFVGDPARPLSWRMLTLSREKERRPKSMYPSVRLW